MAIVGKAMIIAPKVPPGILNGLGVFGREYLNLTNEAYSQNKLKLRSTRYIWERVL